MEEELVKRAGVPFQAIPAAGLHGVGPRALPRNTVTLMRGRQSLHENSARISTRRFIFHRRLRGRPNGFCWKKHPDAAVCAGYRTGTGLEIVGAFCRPDCSDCI